MALLVEQPSQTCSQISDLAPAMLTGIVLSSVLMQRNSPDTHIVVRQSRLITHQVAEMGREELYQVQRRRWKR